MYFPHEGMIALLLLTLGVTLTDFFLKQSKRDVIPDVFGACQIIVSLASPCKPWIAYLFGFCELIMTVIIFFTMQRWYDDQDDNDTFPLFLVSLIHMISTVPMLLIYYYVHRETGLLNFRDTWFVVASCFTCFTFAQCFYYPEKLNCRVMRHEVIVKVYPQLVLHMVSIRYGFDDSLLMTVSTFWLLAFLALDSVVHRFANIQPITARVVKQNFDQEGDDFEKKKNEAYRFRMAVISALSSLIQNMSDVFLRVGSVLMMITSIEYTFVPFLILAFEVATAFCILEKDSYPYMCIMNSQINVSPFDLVRQSITYGALAMVGEYNFHMIGVLSNIVFVLTVIILALYKSETYEIPTEFPSAQEFSMGVGIFVLCFAGHACLTGVYTSMKEPERFPSVMVAAFVAMFNIYSGVEFSGIILYGADTDPLLTRKMEYWPGGVVCKIATILNVLRSFVSISPLLGVAAEIQEILVFGIEKPFSRRIFRTVLLLFMGSLASIVTVFVFTPCLAHEKTKEIRRKNNQHVCQYYQSSNYLKMNLKKVISMHEHVPVKKNIVHTEGVAPNKLT